jgi:HAD superfamily hydrolase (TIGR01509 family)
MAADREHVAAMIGSDGKRLLREVASRAGQEVDDERAEKLDQRSGELYDRLNKDPRPLHGARTLCEALTPSTVRWAIATSSRREQVGGSVAALRLSAYPTIVDGTHVEHAKPAPDLLLLAARELRTRPADCWYVGDSTWDMEAARAARMTAVAVPYGAASPSGLRGAGAHAVTTLRGLLRELRRRRLID